MLSRTATGRPTSISSPALGIPLLPCFVSNGFYWHLSPTAPKWIGHSLLLWILSILSPHGRPSAQPLCASQQHLPSFNIKIRASCSRKTRSVMAKGRHQLASSHSEMQLRIVLRLMPSNVCSTWCLSEYSHTGLHAPTFLNRQHGASPARCHHWASSSFDSIMCEFFKGFSIIKKQLRYDTHTISQAAYDEKWWFSQVCTPSAVANVEWWKRG